MNILKYFSVFLAALTLIATVGCASTNNESSTGEYIDDTVITTKVKAALIQDEELKAHEINVETFKGVVQLSGFVKERSDIGKATALVKDIDGVKSVKNDLLVK